MSNRILTGVIGMAVMTAVGCRQEKAETVRGKIKRETVVFASKMTGKIKKIYVQEGNVVAPGDTLAEVDTKRYIIATNYMSIERIPLHEGEEVAAGYPAFIGYIPNSTWFRFTIPESKVVHFRKGSAVNIVVVYNKQEYKGTIMTIKPMPRYAGITTTAYTNNKMGAIYEIKVAPLNVEDAAPLRYNATILLKEKHTVI